MEFKNKFPPLLIRRITSLQENGVARDKIYEYCKVYLDGYRDRDSELPQNYLELDDNAARKLMDNILDYHRAGFGEEYLRDYAWGYQRGYTGSKEDVVHNIHRMLQEGKITKAEEDDIISILDISPATAKAILDEPKIEYDKWTKQT